MKLRIKPGNSDFMNKIEANDLIFPPFPPSNTLLPLLAFLSSRMGFLLWW